MILSYFVCKYKCGHIFKFYFSVLRPSHVACHSSQYKQWMKNWFFECDSVAVYAQIPVYSKRSYDCLQKAAHK